jgi:molybdate transport system substrate-binding protein
MWWGWVRNSLKMSPLISFFLLTLLVSCTQKNHEDKAKLYLASSLAVLAEDIQKLSGKLSIDMVFLSSSAIAKQIAQGAPCDAAILADEQWLRYLLQKNTVEPISRLFAKNRLVLVGPHDHQPQGLSDALKQIPKGKKLIIGDPDFVPLGAYTKEALTNIGWLKKLSTQLLPAHSARQASLLLSQGAGSFAILYQSDAQASFAHIIAHLDPSLHRPIEYPFLVCKKARSYQAKALEQLLFSKAFKTALTSKGFIE